MAETGQPDSAVHRIRERVAQKAARRAAARAAADGAPHESAAARVAQPDADRLPPHPPGEDVLPGVHADKPTDIPARGWRQILERAWAQNKADNMPIIAGGVAFFGFLAIFPALIALISIYGLVAAPAQAAAQVEEFTAGLPTSARDVLADQLTALTEGQQSALTVGLVIAILAALWSASGGVGNLITAVNLAYDEVETRNFVKLKATALALTVGAVVFVVITVGLVAVVPVVLEVLPLGVVGTILAQVIRWVALLGLMAGALAVVYRVAPDRDAPRIRWVSLGSVFVTVVWVLVSLAFSFYVDNFGSYNETYGAIAGVIVLMLWLYLTCYLILLGAEINAEAEHQVAHDTTTGPASPMGTRDATVADELPDPPEPTKKTRQSP